MNQERKPLWPLTVWKAHFNFLRRWHRYSVEGIETLLEPGSKLIVGYHGRPIAMDQCMLTLELLDHLGYLPHGIIHGYFGENPLLKQWIDGLGFVTGDGPELEEAVSRGEHIMVQPGGTREGCRSVRQRYNVNWGNRLGYLKLAIRHQIPIVPVGGSGMDDSYLGLNDGDTLSRRLNIPGRLPVWFGLGLGGLWPLALPLPVKITSRLGRPIVDHLKTKLDDEKGLMRIHHQVQSAVQSLLPDSNRGGRVE